MKLFLCVEKNKRFLWGLVFAILFSFCISSSVSAESELKFPLRANYYLGELKDDDAFIRDIARYDLLIVTPAQIKSHPVAIKKIRAAHAGILILAYVPSQSYNLRYWSNDSVFKNFKNIPDSVWMRDPFGNKIVDSFSVQWANLNSDWNRVLLDFVEKQILPLDVDGIFFDMVSHNISWLNGGSLDLNNDHKKDDPTTADTLWLERTTTLLQQASQKLKTKYIIINGSSDGNLQKYINGRMFETFPTPWEGDGKWATVMNRAKIIQKQNRQPRLLVFNGNSNNTGIQNNYSKFRYGFVSALLNDAYFSYDFGDTSHSQLWWYDEYGSDLGAALGPSTLQNNIAALPTQYAPGVWIRQFQNGIALVNSTDQKQHINLGGEYEKFHGLQDKSVNDGSIVTQTDVNKDDGLILLRTFASSNDALFTNGDFVRFFRPDGSRVRNGFFAFENSYKGGDQIAHVDMNHNGKRDLIIVSKNKITMWRDDGQLYAKLYPYTASYQGNLSLAFGDINGDGLFEMIVAPSAGYPLPVQVYAPGGTLISNNWFPLGTKYNGGYSLGVMSGSPGAAGKLLLGTGTGVATKVQLYNTDFTLFREWFAYEKYFKGGVHVAVGDIDGDGIEEIVAGAGVGKKPVIKVFDSAGALKYGEFQAYSAFGNPGIDVRVMDVNFDGKKDIVGMSDGI